jgi:drug/metabolite transporter (DMT)-like permease
VTHRAVFGRGASISPELSPLPLSRANRRGVVAIVGATATFSANDSIVKLVARELPLGEVLFVRGVLTCLLVGGILIANGHFRAIRVGFDRIVLLRSGLEALAALLFTSALLHMPLAELSTVILVSPLIITALSVVFYRETVGWRRWTAITVGFFGTLFVVKPTPSAFDAWALLGILCAFASASRDLLTRRLHPATPSIVVSFMAAASVTAAGLLLGAWEAWQPPRGGALALLAVAAAFLAAGNFLVVLAFRGVDVSAVAPFRYSILIWAGIAGFAVFGEVPDRWSLAGAALIVGSGIYALHRERVRGREVASRATPGA